MKRRDFLSAISGGAVMTAGLRLDALETQDKPKKINAYRVIDAHLHLFNTHLDLPVHFGDMPREYATLENTLAAMDAGGVEKAILISYTSIDIARGISLRVTDPAKSLPVYSKDYMVQAFKKHPDRFWWFTDHVDPARPGYLEDLEQDLKNGAAGVKILSAFHGFLPDHPGFIPVYELCSKYNKPVIMDGSFWYFSDDGVEGQSKVQPIHESNNRRKKTQTIEGYLESLGEVFRRFPDIAICLAHAGTASSVSDYDAIFSFLRNHPNAYCDMAMATGYNAQWFERLVRTVGAQKVMYGTDWPYWVDKGRESYLTGYFRWTMISEDCDLLSEQEKRFVLAENAERFVRNEFPEKTDEIKSEQVPQFLSQAVRLHHQYPVIMIHDHNSIDRDVPRMFAGGVTGKVYQIGLDVDISSNYKNSYSIREGWAEKTMKSLEEAERTIQNNPQRICLATKAADFYRARREGKVAIMFGVEGAKLLEGKLDWLHRFYQKGLRELQLTWVAPNQVVERSGPTGDSLTAFGRDLIKECNALGVIVGLTHITRKAFFDAIDWTEKPLIVSHDALGKGVEEDQLKALANRGGVMGIHFYSTYLGPKPTPEDVVRQIDRMAEIAGIDSVGLGGDFFPDIGDWRDLQIAQGTTNIVWAVEDIGHIAKITEAMLKHGYSQEDIAKVLGGNFLRVCKNVFGS